jgi:hypothetical protein
MAIGVSNVIMVSDRNLGGRKIIFDQLSNHIKALHSIKPTLVTMPPKAHVDQGCQYFGDNELYLSVYQ